MDEVPWQHNLAGLNLVTVEQFLKEVREFHETFPGPGDFTPEELHTIANQPDAPCFNCGSNPVWKYGQSGMCFSCTTGEADGSEDYELIPGGDPNAK